MNSRSAEHPWNKPIPQKIPVPSMSELLAQIADDEATWEEEMENDRQYVVVHDRVAIRTFASISAPIIGARRRGDIIHAVQVDGPWVRLHPDECTDVDRQWKALGAQEGWMLVDGGDAGLGKLLDRIRVPKQLKQFRTKLPPRQLNREEFEVARGLALGMISMSSVQQEYRGIREIVIEAVRIDGMAIQYASPELFDDKEIVLNAVMQNPEAFKYASIDLQNDFEVAHQAIREDWRMKAYASEELQRNPTILAAAKESEKKRYGGSRKFSARAASAT